MKHSRQARVYLRLLEFHIRTTSQLQRFENPDSNNNNIKRLSLDDHHCQHDYARVDVAQASRHAASPSYDISSAGTVMRVCSAGPRVARRLDYCPRLRLGLLVSRNDRRVGSENARSYTTCRGFAKVKTVLCFGDPRQSAPCRYTTRRQPTPQRRPRATHSVPAAIYAATTVLLLWLRTDGTVPTLDCGSKVPSRAIDVPQVNSTTTALHYGG